MYAGRQRDPARRSEGHLADCQHHHQQHDRSNVQRVNVRHQRVVIEAGRNPHQQNAGRYIDNLLPPGALPNRVVSRAENLQDAQRADNHHDEKHRPVEIFDTDELEHGLSRRSCGAEGPDQRRSGMVGLVLDKVDPFVSASPGSVARRWKRIIVGGIRIFCGCLAASASASRGTFLVEIQAS